MSNSRSDKSIQTHHQQVDNARLRRLKKQYEREQHREDRRAYYRRNLEAWVHIQVAFMLFWLFGVFGICIIYLYYIVGQ